MAAHRSRPRSCTDLGDKAIFEHAEKFGERQYRFKSNNRNMMLRFAACFGMFSIMRDMHISPNNLPMKMYKLSTYSFRHEQKGEVIGLKRLACIHDARYALALPRHAAGTEVL